MLALDGEARWAPARGNGDWAPPAVLLTAGELDGAGEADCGVTGAELAGVDEVGADAVVLVFVTPARTVAGAAVSVLISPDTSPPSSIRMVP